MAVKYFAQLRARDPKKGNHHKTYNVAGLAFVAGGPEHEVSDVLAAKLENVYDIGDGERRTPAFKIRTESTVSAKREKADDAAPDAAAPVVPVGDPKPVKAPKPPKADADPQAARRSASRE